MVVTGANAHSSTAVTVPKTLPKPTATKAAAATGITTAVKALRSSPALHPEAA